MKGCITEGKKLGKIQSLEYRKVNVFRDFAEFIGQYKPEGDNPLYREANRKFDSLYFSLVDSSIASKLTFDNNWMTPFVVKATSPLPIKIDYAETLGSDRICSAVGAYSKFKDKKSILIIDLGTATTFNIVSDGVFKGGMISTGIRTSAEALMNKTTLPKVILSSKVKLINNDTHNAIISGIVLQQVLFIQKAIEEYKKLYKGLYVVSTGGGAEIIKKHETGIDKYEPNLVLEGLNQIAIYNETIR